MYVQENGIKKKGTEKKETFMKKVQIKVSFFLKANLLKIFKILQSGMKGGQEESGGGGKEGCCCCGGESKCTIWNF